MFWFSKKTAEVSSNMQKISTINRQEKDHRLYGKFNEWDLVQLVL